MLFAPTPLILMSLGAPEAAAPALPAPESTALFSRLAATTPQQRRTGYAWNPRWQISAGAHYVMGDYDTFQDGDATEDLAYSLDAVVFNWEGERGMGLEFGLMYSTYEVDTNALPPFDKDDVETFRASLGFRLADRGPDNPVYIPYVRGGLMYRTDEGTHTSDDGVGWYLGGGIDLRLGSRFALSPSVLYTDTTSNNAQEWLFGLLLSVGF